MNTSVLASVVSHEYLIRWCQTGWAPIRNAVTQEKQHTEQMERRNRKVRKMIVSGSRGSWGFDQQWLSKTTSTHALSLACNRATVVLTLPYICGLSEPILHIRMWFRLYRTLSTSLSAPKTKYNLTKERSCGIESHMLIATWPSYQAQLKQNWIGPAEYVTECESM